jgi:hypothetical protein
MCRIHRTVTFDEGESIMQRGFLVLFAFAVLLGPAASRAAAQDRADVGITMGYPASVGLIWHATDRIAVRPELSFERRDTDDVGAASASTNTWLLGLGVSGLFYLRDWDQLHAYVSPRYSYHRASTSTVLSGISNQEIELRTTTHTFAGYFGAQYELGDHFGVFGEVGFAYSTASGSSSTFSAAADTSSYGTTSGVGVIFYF